MRLEVGAACAVVQPVSVGWSQWAVLYSGPPPRLSPAPYNGFIKVITECSSCCFYIFFLCTLTPFWFGVICFSCMVQNVCVHKLFLSNRAHVGTKMFSSTILQLSVPLFILFRASLPRAVRELSGKEAQQ